MYSQALDEADLIIDKPPIRYDYEPTCYRTAEHPAGHLHVGAFKAVADLHARCYHLPHSLYLLLNITIQLNGVLKL